MRILAFTSGYDGCGYYRISLMAKYLNKLEDFHVKVTTEYKPSEIEKADILILQKQVNTKALKYVEYAKKLGKKVVTEVDDDYFNIPKSNPAYKYYVNRKDDLIAFYKASDALTVSTPHLAVQLGKFNPNVYSIPNSLDFKFLDSFKSMGDEELYRHVKYFTKDNKEITREDVTKMQEGKTVIGWGGSPTHYDDLKQVSSTLIDICKEDPSVLLVMMACSTQDILDEVPKDQLVLVAPSPIFLYPKNLSVQNWDIGLCPIQDNIFNKSKSNLKYLEFASNKFACICSDVENYSNTVTDGETGLLSSNDPESWYSAITKLRDNVDLRKSIAEKGYSFVRENYNMGNNYKNWLTVYRDILGKGDQND